MPNVPVIQNNFTKGLMTEFTGLNFPENAATDADNCEFTLIGDVLRRSGMDYEDNFAMTSIISNSVVNTYKWNNVGGDGSTQLIVVQVGNFLRFYKASSATIDNPLSTWNLPTTVDLTSYITTGGSLIQTECTFADGNGYLFVYSPTTEPVYCSFDPVTNVVTPHVIAVNIRDFSGMPDGLTVNQRPAVFSAEHNYNLSNQGWTAGSSWATNSTTVAGLFVTSQVFTVPAGMGVTLGDLVVLTYTGSSFVIPTGVTLAWGTVTAYVGTNLTVNIAAINTTYGGQTINGWFISPTNHGYINTWFSAEGNYPSNADVWWYFKDDTDTFNPATTQPKVTLSAGQAPQGHYIINAFAQQRSLVSSISGLTDVTTNLRPNNGAWFQGRTWFTGLNSGQQAKGDAAAYIWTENIYFSQVNVGSQTNFGNCYQVNDPTSETLFDLLPTDGGVITVQGSGPIYKLFPIQNGMLVFAANGVWFITGSQGIGFKADDYTITKISSVQSISSTSFVDVMGLPYFWNEEGIYSVQPQQQGGLSVEPITVGTILSFYNNIPIQSKKYVRGAYHPIDYVIQWIYKSEIEVAFGDRYRFDKILNYNVYNKAFYPYTITSIHNWISGINYVQGPGGSTSPDPVFKYLTNANDKTTFSELNDDVNFKDWVSSDNVGVSYESHFVTGFSLSGKSLLKFQAPYIYVFSRNDPLGSYKIQSIWDYATSGNSGRFSSQQVIRNIKPNYGFSFAKVRLRGRGLVMQIKISSWVNEPFDIMGWSLMDTVNQGV